jgi:hypothetical protein
MLRAIYLLLLAWAYAPVALALPIEQRGSEVASLPRQANLPFTLEPVHIYDRPVKNDDSDEVAPNEFEQSLRDDLISNKAIRRRSGQSVQSVSDPNKRGLIGATMKLMSKLKDGKKVKGGKGKPDGKKSFGALLRDGADALADAARRAAEAAAEAARRAAEAAAEAARKAAEGGSGQAAKPVGG